MIKELSSAPVPQWLLAASVNPAGLPLKEMLQNSVYYPASGFDGGPIRLLGGNYYSFIYVDYGVNEIKLLNELHEIRGYRPLFVRDVMQHELTPHGWVERIPKGLDQREFRRPPSGWIKPPFAKWVVLERTPGFDDQHGPTRLSLLYICGEGVATFQALYYSMETFPDLVCVIQPGTGFGGNWTNFCDEKQIFARTVAENYAGHPRYLMHGWSQGHAKDSCWPNSYPREVARMNHGLAIWGKK